MYIIRKKHVDFVPYCQEKNNLKKTVLLETNILRKHFRTLYSNRL